MVADSSNHIAKPRPLKEEPKKYCLLLKNHTRFLAVYHPDATIQEIRSRRQDCQRGTANCESTGQRLENQTKIAEIPVHPKLGCRAFRVKDETQTRGNHPITTTKNPTRTVTIYETNKRTLHLALHINTTVSQLKLVLLSSSQDDPPEHNKETRMAHIMHIKRKGSQPRS